MSRTMGQRWSAVKAHPSAVLLAAQLLAVLAYPFLDEEAWGRAVVGSVQLVIVLTAMAAVRPTPALTWVAVGLGGPAMVLTIAESWRPEDPIVLASALFHAPFYFYISYAMIKYLFHDDRVTRDELFATGAAFTVVAWGFAYVYAGCQALWADSFIGSSAEATRSWFELLYLSFSTLTSVGLSDVVPVEGHARAFAMVEMVIGIFYVALVVARLVSMAVLRHRPKG